MKATLLDTLHGTQHIVDGDRSVGYSTDWAEGDLAHDSCRRALLNASDDEDNTRFRFIVVAAEFEPGEPEFTLWRLNALYPRRILERYDIDCSEITGTRHLVRPTWRMPDARELIDPQRAQRLLRLWEVTGVNFIAGHAHKVVAAVLLDDREEKRRLVEIAKKDAHYWLDSSLDVIDEEWQAEEKAIEAAKKPRRRALKKQEVAS